MPWEVFLATPGGVALLLLLVVYPRFIEGDKGATRDARKKIRWWFMGAASVLLLVQCGLAIGAFIWKS